MMYGLRILGRFGRTLLILLLVTISTISLTRFAPGYFTDVREMDARYAGQGRSDLAVERRDRGTLSSIVLQLGKAWLGGGFGQSRQYAVPVTEILSPRLAITGVLLAHAIAAGWLLAFAAALLCSLARGWQAVLGAPFTIFLAIPVGAMGTVCLLTNMGGPALVLTLVLAARDFKFAYRLFQSVWHLPHVLQARAQGIPTKRILWAHLLPGVSSQLLSLASLSIVTALSAVVPVEVIFDVPGVGQLAWNAAMNRDLPVLVAITLLMAALVAGANMLSNDMPSVESL